MEILTVLKKVQIFDYEYNTMSNNQKQSPGIYLNEFDRRRDKVRRLWGR